METVNQIGAMLNLVGILVALTGLSMERRLRKFPGARYRMRVFRGRVWRPLRRRSEQPAPIQTTGTSIRKRGGTGLGVHWLHVRPTDPLETQIAALQKNAESLRRYVDQLDAMQKRGAAVHAKTAERERRRVDRLEADAKTSAETERKISGRAIRVEIWGVGIALLGTGLSSVATLLG